MLVDWHRHGSRLGARIFPRNGVHPNNPNPLQHPNKKKKNPGIPTLVQQLKKEKVYPPPQTHSRGPLHPQLFIEALLEVIGYVSLHPICLTAKIFCTPSLETKYFVSEPSIICSHFCSICTCSYNRLSFSKENYNYFIFIRYDHGHLNVDFYDSETR